MEFLTELWLPILLSAVLVFIVSSVIHVVLPIHKGDYKKLPGEENLLAEMRSQGVSPGLYMFPCAGSMKEMSSPEMIAKCQQGPVGSLTVMPSGPPRMGRSLVQWFLYSILVGLLVAYVSWVALGQGAPYLTVFRVAGTAAILGYAVGHLHDSIWKGVSWRVTLKFVIDGVVYGLVTAGTFGWLWPSAS
ncbi:MAG: hypothetical protein AB1486_20000 [Planctomycetota bacterium]